MPEDDWNTLVGAIRNRINDQVVWHRKHGSDASDRRLLEIAVEMEREKLNFLADQWEEEEKDDLAVAARALSDALAEIAGLGSN